MSLIKVQLGTVQETLLITLWARAEESRSPAPVLHDETSVRIRQSIDYDFGRLAQAQGTQVGVCVRGWLFDRWVERFMTEHPDGTVVEIGAGLNTRFERTDNGRVRWFDLDLPDAMALRRQFFEDTDRRRSIAASVLDTDWIAAVKAAGSGPTLFVAEGVLMYLEKAQVQRVFALLEEHFAGALFAFDSMSPFMLKNQKRHDAMKHYEARFRWAVANVYQLQAGPGGLRVLEVKTLGDGPSQYRRRVPLWQRLLFAVPPFKDMYRLSLVRLGAAEATP
ncbi:class I SAM-dependent methyltransferase [Gloeobacter morelensis]|uniref:Class I SAM-dependent methyltransferase n=1 Tax=Gloeobacter morelensis MG652769 TaxID=2781736 RepID=A0ABY3PJP9_9CYAN|nr:class I SAM-dependent methyltransferase [Gloeobacter morelensis]UFP93844.1 class I SAM-dependent methyltransferase [Gloeobacter morelensis MG652769]